MEPVPEEQEAIRLARRLRRRGLSLRDIGGRLGKAGYRPKGGGRWHPPQVARLLPTGSRREGLARREPRRTRGDTGRRNGSEGTGEPPRG